MKRIFSFVLSALLAVVFTTAQAQQYTLIWKSNGALSIKSVAQLDSLTFTGDKILNIITYDPISVSTNVIHAKAKFAWNNDIDELPNRSEIGVCFSSTNATPTYADEHICIDSTYINLGFFDDINDFTLSNLSQKTTYYYRTYVKLGEEMFYGNTCSAQTVEEVNYTINGHKFIDLGLPSGMLWAESNVGADSPTEKGDYFAWGETEPKAIYNMDSYKWTYEELKYSDLDNKTVLDVEDDVATVKWGAKCRMPSKSDFEELKEKCEWIWQEDYQGRSGFIVIGPNGSNLFLPETKMVSGNHVRGGGEYYWTRNLGNDYSDYYVSYDRAYYFNYPEGCIDICERWCGLPVRPVAER